MSKFIALLCAAAITAGSGTLLAFASDTYKTTDTADQAAESAENFTVNPFKDCQNQWFTDAVTFVYNNGLIKGYDGVIFGPQDTVTRDQLAVILYRLNSKGDIVTEGENWADVAEEWVSDTGIMNEFMAEDFNGSANLTREQIVSTIYNTYKLSNEENDASDQDLSVFADTDKITGYARDAVKWAVMSGIIKGDDKKMINPADNVTRAETSAILQRYIISLRTERTADYMTVINRVKTNPAVPEVAPGFEVPLSASDCQYSDFVLLDMDGDGNDELLCWWTNDSVTIASVYKAYGDVYRIAATVSSHDSDPYVNSGELFYVHKDGKDMLLKTYAHGEMAASYGLLELSGSELKLYDGYYFERYYSDGFPVYSLKSAVLGAGTTIEPGAPVEQGSDEAIHERFIEYIQRELENAHQLS
ncbi:MAG: S-layer homology domain-containing protein [Clostridiales bacterium]|nr:S-layer homology domain-containing protein [Clostridiales bacterium]